MLSCRSHCLKKRRRSSRLSARYRDLISGMPLRLRMNRMYAARCSFRVHFSLWFSSDCFGAIASQKLYTRTRSSTEDTETKESDGISQSRVKTQDPGKRSIKKQNQSMWDHARMQSNQIMYICIYIYIYSFIHNEHMRKLMLQRRAEVNTEAKARKLKNVVGNNHVCKMVWAHFAHLFFPYWHWLQQEI